MGMKPMGVQPCCCRPMALRFRRCACFDMIDRARSLGAGMLPARARSAMRGMSCSLIAILGMCALVTAANSRLANHVDPFLGVEGGGNTVPGPSLPFGMIKPGPDVGSNESNSGWEPTGDINGFSQTHVSGTGGGPKYGNILVQPTVGIPAATGYSSPRENEQSSIGYYRVTLKRYPI